MKTTDSARQNHIENIEASRLGRRDARRHTVLRRGLLVVLSLTCAFACSGSAFASSSDSTRNANTTYQIGGITVLKVVAHTSNVFVGNGIGLRMAASATNNVATGSNALRLDTTGSLNTASGIDALGSNRTGNFNTANGWGALLANTTGADNTASGSESLWNNTTGKNNSADGSLALTVNTTGEGNTASGFNALGSNSTGAFNTASGFTAGEGNTTGSNDTFLGFGANVSTGALSNATAIGFKAVVGESNALVLGGTGSNAVNVGIGTATPHSAFQVVGAYAQIPSIASAPPARDCASTADYGRMVVRSDTNKLYFCSSGGWILAP